jgi:hypothetical protein
VRLTIKKLNPQKEKEFLKTKKSTVIFPLLGLELAPFRMAFFGVAGRVIGLVPLPPLWINHIFNCSVIISNACQLRKRFFYLPLLEIFLPNLYAFFKLFSLYRF